MGTMEVDDGGGLPQAISALKESVSISASIKEQELDELRYSRLIHTLGRDSFECLRRSRVLVLGCGAVGAEVAKNLALSGVRGVGLVDDGLVSRSDLGSNLLLREQDVGRNRARATAHWLKQLSGDVEVVALQDLGNEGYASVIASYQAVVATNGRMPYFLHVDSVCRAARVPFILAVSRGVVCSVFADFGPSFTILDDTGEPTGTVMVESITQDFPATVTVVEEQRHGLEEGDEIIFDGIQGMTELNNRVAPFVVTVTGTSSFTIPEDTREFARYVSGGWFRKLKRVRTLEFLSLEESLPNPRFVITDAPKACRSPHLHVAFQAVDEYENRQGRILNQDDLEEVVALAKEIWRESRFSSSKCPDTFSLAMDVAGDGHAVDNRLPTEDGRSDPRGELSQGQWENGVMEDLWSGRSSADASTSRSSHTSDALEVETGKFSGSRSGDIDESLVRVVAKGAHVELAPMAAITGGLATQEIIKVTLTFT